MLNSFKRGDCFGEEYRYEARRPKNLRRLGRFAPIVSSATIFFDTTEYFTGADADGLILNNEELVGEALRPFREVVGVEFSPIANEFLSGAYTGAQNFSKASDYRAMTPQFAERGLEKSLELLDLLKTLAAETRQSKTLAAQRKFRAADVNLTAAVYFNEADVVKYVAQAISDGLTTREELFCGLSRH